MKTSGIIIIVIIALALGFFLARSCEEPEYPDLTEELEAEKKIRESLEQESLRMMIVIDSLKNQRPQIEYKTVYIKSQIDSSIAEDSSNAIVEYKNQLVRNNELPDESDGLSFREIGLGALLMSEIPQLKLTIQNYEQSEVQYSKIIENCKLIKKSYSNTIELKSQEVERWKLLYQGEQAWHKSEWFWGGLGVLGTLITVWASGRLK